MSYTTYKSYIKNFDFANPEWDKLPRGFPNLEKIELTREEGHLLDAIKLAWLTTTSTGRRYLCRKVTRTGTFLIICLISLMGLIRLITLPSEKRLIKPVNAAATISATLKYFNLEP